MPKKQIVYTIEDQTLINEGLALLEKDTQNKVATVPTSDEIVENSLKLAKIKNLVTLISSVEVKEETKTTE